MQYYLRPLSVFLLMISHGMSALAMPPIDPKCDKQHLKAVNNHYKCTMKELSKSFHIPNGDFDADFAKCNEKFDKRFAKALAGAGAKEMTCTTIDGAALRQAIEDDQTELYNHVRFGDGLPELPEP